MLLPLLVFLSAYGDLEGFLKPGDHIWVGIEMARGYQLPFGKRLTIKKIRVLLQQEARIVFEEYPRRYYLRTDFGNSYAFRENPYEHFDFSDEQWQNIKQERVHIGMSKEVFLCIKPKAEEIHLIGDPGGTIEQWIYREEPIILFGRTKNNPPTHIYFFQNDRLIQIL